MAWNFPDGALFQFSSTFAAAKTVSAFTNANPGVATSTAHGYVDGDELLLTSNWEECTDTIFVADQLSADTLSLKDLDTSLTTIFPAGLGAGSTLQKVSSWQTIPQVLTIGMNGGDARTATISPLARSTPINVVLGTNPTTVTLTIGHDPSNAVYKQMRALARVRAKVAFKMLLRDGSATYGYGNMVVGAVANLQNGRENQNTVTFTTLGQVIEYGA